MSRAAGFATLAVLCLLSAAIAEEQPATKKPYRIAPVDLKQRVVWGSTCEGPDGSLLSFGGQDQEAEDGIAHTRFRPRGGEWTELLPALQAADPLRDAHRQIETAQRRWKQAAAIARRIYFSGSPQPALSNLNASRAGDDAALHLARQLIADSLESLSNEEITQQRGRRAIDLLALAATDATALAFPLTGVTGETLNLISAIEQRIERTADALAAEPPPRALSGIVHEPRTGLYVLFGGDHFDYLTCDTWVFDPLGQHWQPRVVAFAPPPRAAHAWTALGNGKLVLRGGYTYTSSTDYCGSQYAELDDGEWTYDAVANKWTGGDDDKLVQSSVRTFRSGPFAPRYFWQDPPPNVEAFEKFGKLIPSNTWTQTRPPQLPQLNRDWGTAVYDPQHDLILRFAGGHSAHGGSDVLQYHCRTNRWELCCSVEFPLGQLYSNTSYPEGVNFHGRPWITGHTYQSYGYDTKAQLMIFSGQRQHSYLYDPLVGEWSGRITKPAPMQYDSCFYTLTTCATPAGLICWTNQGKLFRYAADSKSWSELALRGAKLPGAEVDNSTLLFDSRRNRLLLARKPYGESPFDGILHAVDLSALQVSRIEPAASAAAGKISYLCQLRYDRLNDLVLCGCTFADADGQRRTPAYDCDQNRWVSLAMRGDDPSGPTGRNVSLGLMYDQRRGQFWAVDAASRVYVLRLEPGSADLRALQ